MSTEPLSRRGSAELERGVAPLPNAVLETNSLTVAEQNAYEEECLRVAPEIRTTRGESFGNRMPVQRNGSPLAYRALLSHPKYQSPLGCRSAERRLAPSPRSRRSRYVGVTPGPSQLGRFHGYQRENLPSFDWVLRTESVFEERLSNPLNPAADRVPLLMQPRSGFRLVPVLFDQRL